MFPIETTCSTVAPYNNILMGKLGHETSLIAYSTDKRSIRMWVVLLNDWIKFHSAMRNLNFVFSPIANKYLLNKPFEVMAYIEGIKRGAKGRGGRKKRWAAERGVSATCITSPFCLQHITERTSQSQQRRKTTFYWKFWFYRKWLLFRIPVKVHIDVHILVKVEHGFLASKQLTSLHW